MSREQLERVFSAQPTIRSRVAVSILVAIYATTIILFEYRSGRLHSDFGMIWFGARALLSGQNAYELIGPGRVFDYEWTLIYPAPALVVAIPLAWLSEPIAAAVFVFASTALLSFGITKKGWYLLPLFVSEAFVSSARLGQWSIIMTAALFIPALAAISVAKPQAALPVLAASTSRRAMMYAVAGGIILVALSLVLQPDWIHYWLQGVRSATNMEPPIVRFGGVLVLLALLKWKRPETWLLLMLAVLPTSWGWYGTLPLLTIAASLPEALFLVACSSIGQAIAARLSSDITSLEALYQWTGTAVVMTSYLPAVLLILLRPNSGPSPAWMQLFSKSSSDDDSPRGATQKRNAGV